MNRAGRLIVSICLLSLACATRAVADEVRRVRSERRPYITEIGAPYEIDAAQLQRESGRISDLRAFVDAYGRPDYAEVQAIRPQWPWAAYEVRMYYLDRDLEVALGQVFLSPAYKDFGVLKFYAEIEPAKRYQIERVLQARALQGVPATAPAYAGDSIEAVVMRAEAAAERAARAAERAETESRAAALAAERQASIIEKMH